MSISLPIRSGAGAPARRARLVVAAAAVTLSLGACAEPPTDVAAQLQASDLQAIADATQAALEKNAIGESTNWTNPATGHLGTVTPTATAAGTGKDAPCRQFQQTATAEQRTAIVYDTACRGADGRWASVDRDSLSEAMRTATGYVYPYFLPYPYYDYPSSYCHFTTDPLCDPYGLSPNWRRRP